MVTAAGGTVASDLTEQIGVVVATSAVPGFDATLRASGLVEDAAREPALPGSARHAEPPRDGVPGGGPEPSADLLEEQQWDMQQIRTEEAHAVQAGSPRGGRRHPGQRHRRHATPTSWTPRGSNVDCDRGRDFVTFRRPVPASGTPDPCVDNQFHGTHVAGTVGARGPTAPASSGVAPNVTLVPVKVCDTDGLLLRQLGRRGHHLRR